MKPELVQAVLRRGAFKCAWCGCALNTGRVADRGTVCQLDLSDEDSSMAAACAACTGEFTRWWPFTVRYSVEQARRILGRHNGYAFSGPFVDYLESAAPNWKPSLLDKRRGIVTLFDKAVSRVEAQRHAPLGLVRKGRAA